MRILLATILLLAPSLPAILSWSIESHNYGWLFFGFGQGDCINYGMGGGDWLYFRDFTGEFVAVFFEEQECDGLNFRVSKDGTFYIGEKITSFRVDVK